MNAEMTKRFPSLAKAIKTEAAVEAAKQEAEQALREVVDAFATHGIGDKMLGARSMSGKPNQFIIRSRSAQVTEHVDGMLAVCIYYRGNEVKKDGSEGTIESYYHQRMYFNIQQKEKAHAIA